MAESVRLSQNEIRYGLPEIYAQNVKCDAIFRSSSEKETKREREREREREKERERATFLLCLIILCYFLIIARQYLNTV